MADPGVIWRVIVAPGQFETLAHAKQAVFAAIPKAEVETSTDTAGGRYLISILSEESDRRVVEAALRKAGIDARVHGMGPPASDAPERRRQPRLLVSIPVMLRGGAQRIPGLVENLSVTGALVTQATEIPPIGATFDCRLLALQSSVRTMGADTLDIVGSVVRHTAEGFAIEFRGETEAIEGLLDRALGRGAVAPQPDWRDLALSNLARKT